MSPWNLTILIIVGAVGLMVLMKLFFNRKGGRDESTSNRLMQLRVFIQAVVVGGILLVLWLMGGGRPN
ncbi:twin transmembrane helix small protein [Rhizobium sp. XQZ8]|nr:twin transmembrane helix small protein [Rhizobium populisoli]